LMGLLVALWGPIHLWSLAYAYSDDYSKADVPMLPSVVSEENASRGVLVALAVLITSSYTLMPWTTSTFYPLAITVVNLLIGVAGVKFYLERSLKAGWWIFKLTAPHIVIVFLAFMVERIIFA
jgi:protoheme IX farnesyltransferase